MSKSPPENLPWPEGWSPPRRVGWILLSACLGLTGVATLVVGSASVISGEVAQGATVVYGGLLCLLGATQGLLACVGVRRKIVDTVRLAAVSKSGEVAVFIPYSRLLYWLICCLPVLLFIGVAPVAVWSIVESATAPDAGSAVIAVISTTCAVYLVASVGQFLRQRIACGYIALSPTGIYHRSWAFASFVPWEHVVAIWPFEGGGPIITVQATADADGWLRRTSRFWRQPEAGSGLNLTVRGMYLSVDPALAYHAMQFYFNNPHLRAELAGDEGVRRLRSGDIPAAPSHH